MEPASALGVASGVAQLADLAATIASGLYKYFRTVKHAPKLSRELRSEALLVADTLEELRSIIQSDNLNIRFPREDLLKDSLSGLSQTMNLMASRLEVTGKDITKRLIWPFTQNENEGFLLQLERHKNLILNSAGL